MDIVKPVDGEAVWIEYPEGKHFEAEYNAPGDFFTAKDGSTIPAKLVANWSRQEHGDVDISDNPQAPKGKLTRS